MRLLLSKLTLLTLCASAQEPTSAGKPEEMLPEIVITATRSQTDLLKVPSVVRTLSAEQLQERQVRTLPEALREIPGVNVQKTSNGQGSPFIRGFTGFRNLALIDGIRFNNSTFREGPNQYWNTIDSYAIERLELVPGQGSVLYGSDAIGGTINMFTKGSGYIQEQPGYFFHGITSYRGSTAEESNAAHQEIQFGEGGKWGLHLGASLKSFGDVHDAELGDQPHTGYDEWAYDAKLEISLDPNWTLTAVHQQLRQNDVWRTHATIYGISYEGSTVGTDLKRSFDQERSLSYLRLEGEDLKGFIDSVSFTVSLQTSSEDEDRIRRLADNRVDYNQTRLSTIGFDLQFQSQTPLGRLTYGADYFRDSVNSASQRYRLNGTLHSNGIQGPVGDDSTYHLLGLYLQDEIDLGDRIHLFIGGRYTYAKASVGIYDDRSTITIVRDRAKDDWRNYSGSARVTLDLDEKDQYRLYAGVSQGFRAPNLSDLSRLDIARSGEQEVPSTGLSPEEYVNFELGLKADTEHFSGQLGYFYTLIDDMIIRHETGELLGGNRVVEKKNGGDGYMQGVELSGQYRFNPNWSVFGHATWTEGRVDQFVGTTTRQQVQPLSRVVPLMWRAGVRWQTVDRRYWTELVALGQSDSDRLNAADRLDTQRIPPNGNPGFVWVTLRGGVQVTKNLDVTLALENLLDRQIRYAGSGSNEAGFGAVFGATVKW